MKSVSAKQVFRMFPYLKDVFWDRELWKDGYFVQTVRNKLTAEEIQTYIQYQHRVEQMELDL